MDHINKISNTKTLYEPSTGLPTKDLLLDRFKMNMAYGTRFGMSTAVCYLRIQFPIELLHNEDQKLENQLQKLIVSRLKQCVREIDTIGVVNSTDFIILLTNVSKEECTEILERMISHIKGDYTIKQRTITIKIAIGTSIFPYDGRTSEQLIMLAQAQMYEVIALGSNSYRIYRGDLHNQAYRKARIENDLRYAVKHNHFTVHYQPQIQLDNLKVVGVEALIRWEHSELGDIKPSEFIPIAETTGFSNELFYWLFRTVCKHIKEHLVDTYLNTIKVSVNISIHQILTPNFEEMVCQTLHDFGLSYECITFEITESINLYNLEVVKVKLLNLKNLGFQVAIDDFGFGYFSFSDLLELPINIVKFDKRFVRSLIDNKKLKHVISPIIEMSHNLGLKVVIEGVERVQDFKEWQELKCDIIQGYFISKPKIVNDLLSTIEKINHDFSSKNKE